MKLVSFWFVFVSLFTTNIVQAAEQKIIFNVESLSYRQNWEETCQQDCKDSYKDESVAEFMKQGWRIVSSSPKTAPGGMFGKFCSCIGTQFVIQKDDPAPIAKPDVPSRNEELLKQENDLLKREIYLLKQEIESLKAQAKPKQKKK